MYWPAAIPAIGLGAGITAGIFFLHSLPSSVLIAVFLCAVGAFWFRSGRAVTALISAGFVLCGAVLGHDADSAARNQSLRAVFDDLVLPAQPQLFGVVEGRLRTDALKGPSGVTLDMAVESFEHDGVREPARGGALIGVGGGPSDDRILQWRAGRRIAFPATLRTPTKYLDPGVPDGERQLAWRGVALVGSVKSDRLVEIASPGTRLAEARAAVRDAVRRAVASSVTPWSLRSSAIVSAILIGDRAGLEDDVQRRLQEAGTYHVIAISGGNVAILAGLLIVLLRACRAGPRSSALVVIVMLTAYASIVEGGSSVGRATLMAAIYFTAQACGHRCRPLNVAALTAAILFCAAPLQVVDAGFALTFGATLGILVGMAKMADVLPASWWLRGPSALLVASACAEIALLPVNAFVFSRVTAAGLIVNFAAIPMMTLVQIGGMAAVLLTAVSSDVARGAGWVAHAGVEGLVGSAGLVDIAPWLTRRLAPPPFWIIAAYYASLIWCALATRTRLARAFLIASGLWILVAPAFPSPSRLLHVTYLDVGQGDAAIVRFPDGRTLSVDAGGLASSAFDIGGRVVGPAFWALGVRRLDYMTVSHGDVDHIGGAASLFRDFKPFEIWEGVPVPPHAATRELRALADAEGTTWRTLQPGDRLAFGEVDVVVHHPPRPEWERQRVRNDDSQVLEVLYGGVSFVFTGDIGREVEQAVAPRLTRVPLRVLKVPHHGSATSSSHYLLDGLRPDVAVISVGRGNPFGHPVPAVLGRYRDIGAAIYRTDHDGAVSVETDGTTVRVRTFNGRRLTLTTKGR